MRFGARFPEDAEPISYSPWPAMRRLVCFGIYLVPNVDFACNTYAKARASHVEPIPGAGHQFIAMHA